MSAFVVEHEHINVLIWAGLRYGDGRMSWYYDNPTRVGTLTGDTVDTVGQMLLDANVASVNGLYRRNDAAEAYRWRPPTQTLWEPVALLKAIQCFEYQACEVDRWESSEAERFCRTLKTLVIGALPGYAEAPWSISATSVMPGAPVCLLRGRRGA